MVDTVVNAKPDMFRKMPTNAKVCRVSYSHLLCTNFEANIFCVLQSLRILYFFKDFDECKTNIDGCTQICTNVNGSYDCDCYFGFSLDDDRNTCSKGKKLFYLILLLIFMNTFTFEIYMFLSVQDICLLFPGLNCSYGCKQDPNNQTTGFCFCPEGYVLSDSDKSSCNGKTHFSLKREKNDQQFLLYFNNIFQDLLKFFILL